MKSTKHKLKLNINDIVVEITKIIHNSSNRKPLKIWKDLIMTTKIPL